MELKGNLESYGDKHLTVAIPDGFDIKEIKRKHPTGKVMLDFIENDEITDMQRDHYWALVGDIVDYTGYPDDVVDAKVRVGFMKEECLDDYPSIRRHAMKKDMASKLLEYTINLCLENGIPFRKQQFYLTTDTSKMLYGMLMKRLCWICGKPNSDIMHVEAVGIGRNRKKIDHTQHHFMCGCREHHNLQHSMGIERYCLKYHVKPIKLKAEDLIELGVTTQKVAAGFEERK